MKQNHSGYETKQFWLYAFKMMIIKSAPGLENILVWNFRDKFYEFLWNCHCQCLLQVSKLINILEESFMCHSRRAKLWFFKIIVQTLESAYFTVLAVYCIS